MELITLFKKISVVGLIQMMNKILIALVLAIVMSGNAYAELSHLFCSDESGKGWGYAIDSNKPSNPLLYYNSQTDRIDSTTIIIEWSAKYIAFIQSTNNKFDGYFRINRENLDMQRSYDKNYPTFEDWGKCELIVNDGKLHRLWAKVKKFHLQKQNNNKF